MLFVSLFSGLFLTTNVHAQTPAQKGKAKGKKMRLKLSTPLYSNNSETLSNDLLEVTTKQSGLSLYTQPARLEFTYRVAKRFEVGAMFSFGGIKTEMDTSLAGTSTEEETTEEETTDETTDDGTTSDNSDNTAMQRDESIMYLTAAYNFKLAKGVRGFVQPIVGISYLNEKVGDSVDTVTQKTVFGADIGARFRLTDGVQFDLAAEYLMGNGTMTDINDNEMDAAASSINIRAGLGARF